jgi:hypothetical protein
MQFEVEIARGSARGGCRQSGAVSDRFAKENVAHDSVGAREKRNSCVKSTKREGALCSE